MKRTNYIKIGKHILDKIDFAEYSKDFSRGFLSPKTIRDYELIFTGMRLQKNISDQESWEELQKVVPITDEELEYYLSLPEKKQ